jgi:hypothetical protein
MQQSSSRVRLKELITTTPVLGYYSPKAETRVTPDASKVPGALGAFIEQMSVEGHWKPTAYAARSLNKTEINYAQIEKETLAIVFACERFHEYLYGINFLVLSDHQPLQSLFKWHIHECPPRIQRHLLTLQRYDITVQYIPEKKIPVPDALSRAAIDHQDNDNEEIKPWKRNIGFIRFY